VLQANAVKKALRDTALARREALSAVEREAAAATVAARGLPVAVATGAVLSGYSPIRSEFDPVPLMRHMEGAGATLALPVIVARDQPLLFRQWLNGTVLLKGQLGILEPDPAAPALDPDIMLVPLAAFDRRGHRIGYGAGHYDRSLAMLRARKAVIAIGLAFSVQEVAAVPNDGHDERLDFVLTETETIDLRGA
jgi:5-formyltetrahydrofolate cyclo-ligase